MLKGKIKKALVSLSLIFCCVAQPAFGDDVPQPAKTSIPDQMEGLWKVNYVNAVVEIKKCAPEKACLKLYWLDKNDPKIYKNLVKVKDGDNHPITERDIMSLCGLSPELEVREIDDKSWSGKGELPTRDVNFGIKMSMPPLVDKEGKIIAEIDDSRINVTVSKFVVFRYKETWHRIQPGGTAYPQCQKPPAPPIS